MPGTIAHRAEYFCASFQQVEKFDEKLKEEQNAILIEFEKMSLRGKNEIFAAYGFCDKTHPSVDKFHRETRNIGECLRCDLSQLKTAATDRLVHPLLIHLRIRKIDS